MNERIRELAEQAGFVMWQNEPWNPGDVVDWSVRYDDELKKFAGLIVRECIQVGGPEDSYTDEWFKAKADSVAKIKEHFGVER